ncbi:hypothetical protein H8356DRAFT_1427894 [Neocallimastix lanati (nom. inval.)]|nr:hypothetical protein H8356DRAFT_1427894 [Neocallimastix sp. JGI-2020a]
MIQAKLLISLFKQNLLGIVVGICYIGYTTLKNKDNLKQSSLKNDSSCSICMEEKKNIALIPCGHCFCSSCIKQLGKKNCPICRRLFIDTLHIYD